MEFWLLTIITFLCCIYCCDYPAFDGFEFLIHQKDSFFYFVCCGIIASYLFYIIHLFFSKRKPIKKDKSNKKLTTTKIFYIITIAIGIICFGLIEIGFIWYSNGSGTHNDAKLGYVGAIVGGGMALLGVIMTIIFTIEMQNEADHKREIERKEEFSIQYRPILQIIKRNAKLCFDIIEELHYKFDDEGDSEIEEITEHEEFSFDISVEFENLGRGEIIQANAKCDYEDEFVQACFDKTFKDVFPGDVFTLSFKINIKSSSSLKNREYASVLHVELLYYDCMNKMSKIIIPFYINNQAPEYYYSEGMEEPELIKDNVLECDIGTIIRNVK